MIEGAAAPTDLIEKLRQVARGCGVAARRYQSSPRAVWLHLARLYVRQRIGPREALRMGLADPALSAEALAGCVSKLELVGLQRRVNPDELFWLTGDKATFHARCVQLGLPVPRLWAVFARAGHVAEGTMPRSRKEWEAWFLEHLPSEFMVKPSISGFGEGIRFLVRQAGLFESHLGEQWSAADLYDWLTSGGGDARFVFQQRLPSHPELIRLSGTTSLQTVRMTTFIDRDAHATVPYVNFKMITGANVVDNFRHGKTGNLVSNIALDTGVLGAAMTVAAGGVGLLRLDSHPATGVAINGFRLPWWNEALALARRAAALFYPVRTLGWDIALTPAGPMIVEANHFWDPLPMLLVGPQAQGVTTHGMRTLLELLRRAE